jgi:hypothetical protein
MNSATKTTKARHQSFLTLAASALALAFLFGCADQGATNLYSLGLFGQTLPGPNLQLWRVQESVLLSGTTSTAGLDGYIVWMRNIGNGSTVGPIIATVSSSASPCAVPVSYGASTATMVFGSQGQVINSGNSLQGYASDSHGNIQNTQYSFEEQYNVGVSYCAGVSNTYTISASDSLGNVWTSTFSATVQ